MYSFVYELQNYLFPNQKTVPNPSCYKLIFEKFEKYLLQYPEKQKETEL